MGSQGLSQSGQVGSVASLRVYAQAAAVPSFEMVSRRLRKASSSESNFSSSSALLASSESWGGY